MVKVVASFIGCSSPTTTLLLSRVPCVNEWIEIDGSCHIVREVIHYSVMTAPGEVAEVRVK